MKIVIRHYPDRKKPCLVIEQGNQGIIIGTFRNEEMVRLYTEVLGGNNIIKVSDNRSIDKLLQEVSDGNS